MLKLLYTLDCPPLPALQRLDEIVRQALGSAGGNLQTMADQVLAESRTLVGKNGLDDSKLIIKLHKVRSAEWNVLLIKYKDHPHWYQCEIRKEKSQTRLFS
ncbi:hypothetical protein PBT90_00055 [Algoriphagus halophytocola]|uniref:hypothetical protein n=1 Tax=Algoriphagus halophytocola TaxID=2991499 RepID=UPI0022DE33BE|nr:hypothetical protein [Algoriphagus sp. TR-M9]WBL42363.1 hypothetical protein PBT90_16630 [Algoriphagus sp. TR-M9]WBL43100.1 hypothetical protein PBT90_00055 [Algoriphagus sp. TR-M9]